MSSRAPSTVGMRVDRWALGVFVVVVVCAVPFLLYLGRDQWFFLDEWWLLSDGAASHGGIFDAHNGHWITLTAIAYRINYALWGLRTYLPYQVPVVLLHVGSAVLLRILMRRLGVRGWIATVTALIFVFFGSGSLNIFFGFQISLAGSLFCGLALLLLVDRNGTIDRRDWLALAVGVVGLMTSGVFVPMVVGVGVAALLRRGPWVAAFYTVPLGLIYGIWYLLYGREDRVLSLSGPGEAVRFGARMLSGTFTSLAGSDLAGLALGLVVLGALATTITGAVRARQWAPLSLPVGLVTAWVVFAGLTALARASGFGAEAGDSDRYLHISAALFLPLIALGTEYLAEQNVFAGTLPIVLLAVGLPGNLDALANPDPFTLGDRNGIATLAHSEYVDDVPPDLEPFTIGALGATLPITTGWLAREAKAGHIPTPRDESPALRLSAYGLLALQQEGDRRNERDCPRSRERQVELALAQGQRIVFEGDIRIRVRDGQGQSPPIAFTSTLGSTLVAGLEPLDVVVTDAERGRRPRLCEPRR